MSDVKMEIDLDLDAELEADFKVSDTEETEEIKPRVLVADEPIDRFAPDPRPNVLFLFGVDDLSTSDITTYANSSKLTKIEWIDDSSCNLVFETAQDALEAAQALTDESTLDHLQLVPAKPFIDDRTIDLQLRIATDHDVKERGASRKSRYYQIHGGKGLSKERQEARKEHVKRMRLNGGDGRDVFSRLGQRVSRSRSPERGRSADDRCSSSRKSRSSRSPVARDRGLPDRLKNRLGPRIQSEEAIQPDH